MNQPKTKIVIPFRDRGIDPRRAANLDVVLAWWWAHNLDPIVVDDGLEGDAPFNRHRAYNFAVAGHPGTEVFVFTEADMLIPAAQIHEGIEMAYKQQGLVVPFRQYRYLSDPTTANVRNSFHDTPPEVMAGLIEAQGYPFTVNPESTMDNGKSIGAVNIVSRATLETTGGFTEATHGNWYDDNIIEEGFAYLTGHKTRWVNGPAVHLYHLPGWKGDHLTDADKAATEHNRTLLINMRADSRLNNRSAVKSLMEVRA